MVSTQQDPFSMQRLMELARQRGLEPNLVRLNWASLLRQMRRGPLLLVLDNGNVVAALRKEQKSGEEIVVSDPLYRGGELFYLPRPALEGAWTGAALILKSPRFQTVRAIKAGAIGGAAIVAAVSGFTLAQALKQEIKIFDQPLDRAAVVGQETSSPAGGTRNSALEAPEADDEQVAVASSEASSPSDAQAATAPTMPVPRGAEYREEPEAGDAHGPQTQATASPPFQDDTVTKIALPSPGDDNASPDQRVDSAALVANSAEQRSEDVPEAVGSPDSNNLTPITPLAAGTPTPVPGTDGDTQPPRADFYQSLAPQDHVLPPLLNVTVLVTRGDTSLLSGDITSARLYYERAALAQNATGALRLAESYDPNFLTKARLVWARSDVSLAVQWYRRARALGAREAEAPLRALSASE
jgi:hypothetical protein